jgi:hypothetical protein
MALLLDSATPRPLARVPLSTSGGRDERWLQELLFTHPELLPIDQIAPSAGQVVPVCRELALPKLTGSVFLDILGVTPAGRLVLVECKLWRNPQAKREVVGQILEYAALLRRWSYADLTAKLKSALGWSGQNPLYDHVRRHTPSIGEGRFVDAVSRSLLLGDFDLLVAGDGIRSDLLAIADLLNGRQAGLSRLALVEIQLWADAEGRIVVVPAVALRTEVIEHRVVTDRQGAPLAVVTAEELAAETQTEEIIERIADPGRPSPLARYRAFWQRLIDGVRFDHPDQTSPTHGGPNWVRIALPKPARWMTAYRSGTKEAGIFVTFHGEEGRRAYDALQAEIVALQTETGLILSFRIDKEIPFQGGVFAKMPGAPEEVADDDRVLTWVQGAANVLVSALRPRLVALGRST